MKGSSGTLAGKWNGNGMEMCDIPTEQYCADEIGIHARLPRFG